MSWSQRSKGILGSFLILGLILVVGTVIAKREQRHTEQSGNSTDLNSLDIPTPIRPSILRGLSAAEQVAMMSTLAGLSPDEFEEFIFEPANRYYLEPGTAFAMCGQNMAVLGHLVARGGRGDDIWRGLEQKLTRNGMDLRSAEWRAVNNQAQQNIVALGETEGLVRYAFARGPEGFRESSVSRYLKLNRDFIVQTLRGGFATDDDVRQVLQQTFIQHRQVLASFAEPYCSDIKPQPDPVPRGCSEELEIDNVSDANDETEVLTLSDGSDWRIRIPEDVSVEHWGPGDNVRKCRGFLLHESMTSAEADRVQK